MNPQKYFIAIFSVMFSGQMTGGEREKNNRISFGEVFCPIMGTPLVRRCGVDNFF
ncbi:MAG: hypothetical protein O0V67_00870 [Methanocorpusculum sp.]|nr:hypothetical protein [Methanocorpusculum sp.]